MIRSRLSARRAHDRDVTRRGTRYLNGIRRVSFIVRVALDSQGSLSGVIERVATGAKEAFQGVEAIGPVITRMMQRERAGPSAAPGTGPDPGEGSVARRGRRRRG